MPAALAHAWTSRRADNQVRLMPCLRSSARRGGGSRYWSRRTTSCVGRCASGTGSARKLTYPSVGAHARGPKHRRPHPPAEHHRPRTPRVRGTRPRRQPGARPRPAPRGLTPAEAPLGTPIGGFVASGPLDSQGPLGGVLTRLGFHRGIDLDSMFYSEPALGSCGILHTPDNPRHHQWFREEERLAPSLYL